MSYYAPGAINALHELFPTMWKVPFPHVTEKEKDV